MVAGDRGKQVAGSGSVLAEIGSSSHGEGRNPRKRARGDRASAARAGHALPAGAASRRPGKLGTGAAGGDCGVERRACGAGSEGPVAIGALLAESEARAGGDSVRCDPAAGGALSRSLCADARPLDRAAAVAALLAHRTGSARNQPRGVSSAGGNGARDGEYTSGNGRKAPGNLERLTRTKRELAGGSSAGDGGCDGERLASVEGAPAELDSAGALLEGQSVPGLGRVGELELHSARFVLSSDGDEGVEDAFEGRGGT